MIFFHLERLQRIFKLILVLVLSLSVILTVSGVSAKDAPFKLSIKPIGLTGSYFSLTMAPGETRVLAVELGNYGTARATARTYAADAYTIFNGGLGAKLDGEPTSGPTRWLDYQTTDLDLEPGHGLNRAFKVTVPAVINPGEYMTSLVIQNAGAISMNDAGSIGVNQIIRQVIAIEIIIPGPHIIGLEIGGITQRTINEKSQVAFALKNTGNQKLKPTGRFVLTDTNGLQVTQYAVVMDSIYAQNNTFLEIPLASQLNPGKYTAFLSLVDPENGLKAVSVTLPLLIEAPDTELAPQVVGAVPLPANVNQKNIASLVKQNYLTILSIILGGGVLIVLGVLGYNFWQKREEKLLKQRILEEEKNWQLGFKTELENRLIVPGSISTELNPLNEQKN